MKYRESMQRTIKLRVVPWDIAHILELYMTKLKTHKGLERLDEHTSKKFCDSFKDTSVWQDYPDISTIADLMNLKLEKIFWEGYENCMIEKVDFKFARMKMSEMHGKELEEVANVDQKKNLKKIRIFHSDNSIYRMIFEADGGEPLADIGYTQKHVEKEEEFEIGPNDRLIGFSFGYYDGRLRGIQFKTARCPNSFVFPNS